MNIESTGKRIRYQRKCKGLTQAELAAKSNLSVMSIRRYESDNRIVPDPILKTIANALECNVRDLVPGARQTTPERIRELEKMMWKEEGYIEENAVQQMRRTREEQLLTAYGKLNDFGQAVALVDVERLSTQEKYTDSLEPRTDEERALVEEGRLAELWEKRYSGPHEPSAAPSDGTDTANTENAATGPQETK